ncbi:hypothetical protein [Paenibacillus sp. BK033]|nr:hypothetical protein [Paenibacillus sp. BK033]
MRPIWRALTMCDIVKAAQRAVSGSLTMRGIVKLGENGPLEPGVTSHRD